MAIIDSQGHPMTQQEASRDMESIAIIFVLLALSVYGMGLVAAALSLAGWRTAGGVVGVAAVVSGVWLNLAMPHAWHVWAVPLAAGAWAVGRWAWNEATD